MIDLLADQDAWWDGELQTITGWCRSDFEGLRTRLECPDYNPSSGDKRMLHQATNTLLGYPGVQTTAVEAFLGATWKGQLRDFMVLMER